MFDLEHFENFINEKENPRTFTRDSSSKTVVKFANIAAIHINVVIIFINLCSLHSSLFTVFVKLKKTNKQDFLSPPCRLLKA
jgi:hypothetical protein